MVQNDPFPPADSHADLRRMSPPPVRRSRLALGLLVGTLVGVLLGGAGGYVTRAVTAPAPGPPTPTPAGITPLTVFEQTQLRINQQKFNASSNLSALALPWLAHLSSCKRTGEPGGPRLGPGEAARISCSYRGTVTVYFVEYKSTTERDKARARNLARNIDARKLTPGVAEPANSKTTPSGSATGNYLEYAYKVEDGDHEGDMVCGLWWDNADTPVAAYLLAYWRSGLSESWEPLRDVWQRNS